MILPAILYSAVAAVFFTNSAVERSESGHLCEITAGDLARITMTSLFWPAASAVVAYAAYQDASRTPPAAIARANETFA